MGKENFFKISETARKPRILLFDLETGGVNALKSDLGMILCFGYKWLGEKETHVLTVDQFPNWFDKKKGVNDKGILQAALKIWEEADIIVAHYGDEFDAKFIRGRCAIHGLIPPPPTKQRDTWKIAYTMFNFSSNRLQNLADIFRLGEKKYRKDVPDEWPGWWLRAMAGDTSAIHAMAEYCKQDIKTLEQVYLRLQVYDQSSPRLLMERTKCGFCGGGVQYRGLAYVGQQRYRRYICTSCGRWDRERKKYDKR